MIKYYTKLKERIYDLLTFENEENNLYVEVTLYVVVLGIFFTMFIYFGIEFLHNSGTLLKCINGFISIMFLAIFVKFLVIIDKNMSRKNTEKEILSEESLQIDLNKNLIHDKLDNKVVENLLFEGVSETSINNIIKNESNNPLFDDELKYKINKTIEEMNLVDKNDLIILFSYVQKIVLKNKISNAKILKQIPIVFEIDMPTESYYSQITNNLFEWKDNNAKIKEVKNIFDKSSHYEKFNEIKIKFDSLK